MARMREQKKQLKEWLSGEDWQQHLPAIAALDGKEAIGPLMSFLLLGGEMTARAAVALGAVVAALYAHAPEAAREVPRRFMWHMNEESGNIGWGIPQAFAEVLAACPPLNKVYAAVLISYLIDLGRDDNFCDHALLRRSCFWAVGRLAQAYPHIEAKARPWLIKGLCDEDIVCRGMAAWALAQLPPSLESAPALRRLADAGHSELCEVFDGQRLRQYTVTALAQQALAAQ
ncbi:MAG: HEAT repeat domain-containing protein [Desulfovibrionaceae bacterium]|nr:HEAT repeat domain-containing protein [Desulfovibrionaceae bacterium]